jgi:acetyltransferase-like isoleucine patch superfamily enzyme
MFRPLFLRWFEFGERVAPRIRGLIFGLLFGLPFLRVGRQLKLHGGHAIVLGRSVTLGDGCWIEAVMQYHGQSFSPRLVIGDRVSMSNWSHISCAKEIVLGEGCLIGSKVFIGDHSHGLLSSDSDGNLIIPRDMPLVDFDSIEIGAGTWVCDGAVILAGTKVGPGSVIGANSVVKLREERAALIAGAPAKVLRYLD